MAIHQRIDLKYDTKAINRDIPIKEALALYAGVQVDNEKKYFRCPSPMHNDEKPSAHIYVKGNTCHCFSCSENMDVIKLAEYYYTDLRFSDICKKVLEDFGLDPYQYSNLAEVESIKYANKQNRFYDFFPVNEQDLKIIGLKNPTGREEHTYAVEVSKFYSENMLSQIDRYDENGKEKLIDVTYEEAVDLGVIAELKDDSHKYYQFPNLKELWKDDKYGIEEMLLGKCEEQIDYIHERIAKTQAEIDTYESSHSVDDIKEADKIRNRYYEALTANIKVRLTDKQSNKINDLTDFETNQDMIRFYNQEIDKVKDVYQKVSDHTLKRKEYESKGKGARKQGGFDR